MSFLCITVQIIPKLRKTDDLHRAIYRKIHDITTCRLLSQWYISTYRYKALRREYAPSSKFNTQTTTIPTLLDRYPPTPGDAVNRQCVPQHVHQLAYIGTDWPPRDSGMFFVTIFL